jgi:hypothetical protein
MAITVNSIGRGTGQTTAPMQPAVINADLDNSYPAGGYDIEASSPSINDLGTATLVVSPLQPISDGTTIRYAQIVNDAGTLKLRVYLDATLVEETATTDLVNYTGVEVVLWYE